MKRWWVAAVMMAAVMATSGCGMSMARLRGEQSLRDIYLNAMTPTQAAEFRLMEKQEKDEEVRLLYAQETGVYQKWRETSPETQKLIRKKEIVEGMTADEVRMAWGLPARVECPAVGGQELWLYDCKESKDGTLSFRRQVVLVDCRVAEIRGPRKK